MAEDDFFQLINVEEFKNYISKTNKVIRFVLLLVGLFGGMLIPEVDFNLEPVRKGLIIGFAIGVVLIGIRYGRSGSEWVEESQSDIAVSLIYLIYFFLGILVGHYLHIIVAKMLINPPALISSPLYAFFYFF